MSIFLFVLSAWLLLREFPRTKARLIELCGFSSTATITAGVAPAGDRQRRLPMAACVGLVRAAFCSAPLVQGVAAADAVKWAHGELVKIYV